MKRLALILLTAGVAMPSALPPAAQLESLASRFPYFCPQNFFLDQPGCWGHREAEYRKLLAELSSLDAPEPALVELLHHADPKVRTLAIAVLFAREDPSVLPHIAAKAGDSSLTFPDVLPDARPLLPGFKREPTLQSRTVGEIAEQAVRLCLEPAGFFGGARGSAGYAGFEQYWAARQHRKYCAAWFLVQLGRAGQGSRPTPAERLPKIRAVRRRIDRIPEPDRTWTFLWLNGEEGSEALLSEQELTQACKKLGPEALLESERRERRAGFTDPNITAWWAIGAAELRPGLALNILPEALPRFSSDWQGDDRAHLAAAIWRLAAPPQTEYLREWFYTESPQHAHFPHSRALWLQLVAGQLKAALRNLIAAIVSDYPLASLDWQTLEALAKTVNAVAGKAVVPPSDLEKASHPLGPAHFHRQRERATEKYPLQTAELLSVLAGWREKMRASLPEWSNNVR